MAGTGQGERKSTLLSRPPHLEGQGTIPIHVCPKFMDLELGSSKALGGVAQGQGLSSSAHPLIARELHIAHFYRALQLLFCNNTPPRTQRLSIWVSENDSRSPATAC